jgi:hypothetical protein
MSLEKSHDEFEAREKAEAEHAAAEKAGFGGTTIDTVGNLTITVTGGTAAQRDAVIANLAKIFTQTDQGNDALTALSGRTDKNGNPRPLECRLLEGGGSNGRDGILTIDTQQIDNPDSKYVTYGDNEVTRSMTRIIAHELGHVVTGLDDFRGFQYRFNMNIVDTWENPIMRQLGDANNRMQYLRGCKFDRDKCPQ